LFIPKNTVTQQNFAGVLILRLSLVRKINACKFSILRGETADPQKKKSFVHAYPKSMFSQPVGDSK
jgi:hypothetical protein